MSRWMPAALWTGLLALGLALASPAEAAKRVALVIGNSAYEHVPALRNPANDAADMAKALRALGFEVVEGIDLTQGRMREIVRRFGEVLEGADVGLFYYAGHGLDVAGQNYLAPVDARLRREGDLDFDMVRLDLILRQMERETATNIVFLDACRDNPLARSLARSMGTRSAAIGRGLARIDSGIGTYIAFATQPGNVALDGEGRNSPFTGSLARHILAEGRSLADVMIAVRNDVIAATGGRQVPWEHHALTGQFYFKPPSAAAAETRTRLEAEERAAPRLDEAARVWMVTRDTTSPAVLEAFVARFGDTVYAELAQARLRELRDQRVAVGVPPEASPAAPKAAATAERGWLGVTIQNVTEEIAAGLGLPGEGGVLFSEVAEGGPAASADLRQGDAVLAMDGGAVADARDLAGRVAGLPPGTEVALTVARDGQRREVKVRLGRFPEASLVPAATEPARPLALDEFGLSLRPGDGGVAIAEVTADSEAARRGLKADDLILEVAGRTATQPGDVADGVRAARERGRTAVLLRVRSPDGERFVALPLK